MIVVTKWVVTITSINNDGVLHEFRAEHDTFDYAIRDLITYRKRGYLPINYNIERESRLF